MKNKPAYSILIAISFAHLLNDLLQAVIPAIYPNLEQEFDLSYAQVGLITLCYQLSASIFQPIVGNFTDKNPQAYSQIFGMLFTTSGIVLLSLAPSYGVVLLSVVLVGIGSSIFHPESSRVAYLASGGKRSFAQSIFQIGGNSGTAMAPLLVAAIVLNANAESGFIQERIIWFVLASMTAIIVLNFVAGWYKKIIATRNAKKRDTIYIPNLSPSRVRWSIVVLLILIFSKYFYVASITSYLLFYLKDKFSFTDSHAQLYLFYFLSAIALGTLIGGFLGDKVGRKYIIWFSVLGAAPFTLFLPYASAEMTAVLISIIGFVLASAFPSILVFAQELLPKKLGMISGLFYGFAFGMGGLGSALLGLWADHTSIEFIYSVCAYLPLIGVIAYFLPDMNKVSYRKYEKDKCEK